jgi:hypothetical protein
MPKYLPVKTGRMLWVYLAALAAGLLYALVSAPVGTAVFALLFFGAFLMARSEKRRDEEHLRCLAGEREGESICEFARGFDTRQVDTWIVRAVFEQLQCQLNHIHPSFPVRATDRLKEDLHLDDDDLDFDIAKEVEQRTGRSLNGSSANPFFGKVETVADLVMYFQWQPNVRKSTNTEPA